MYFSLTSGESDQKDAMKAHSLLHAGEQYKAWLQSGGLKICGLKEIILKDESLKNLYPQMDDCSFSQFTF